MTAYSEYGGLVAFDPTRIATDEPVDTSTVRDGVINNAAHLVQSSTQQRVNWTAMAGAADGAAGGGLYPSLLGGAFTNLKPVTMFGPFPVTIAPTGRTARLVIRVGGHVGNGTATFRVNISASRGRSTFIPWNAGQEDAPTEGPDVAEVSTASASPVWLTPNPSYIVMTSPADLAWATQDIAMPRSLGGDPTSARVCYCTLGVWASGTDPAAPPVLDGIYAREFLG